jgi:peptidoglycan hydrolase-like protein with peptidoglycan-binding domain
MVDWKVAPALDQLLDQLNALAPGRSRASDGFKGDDDHARRKSGHNPARFPWHPKRLVLAGDATHDPRGGLDCAQLAAALRTGRDRRLAYVIYDHRIMAGFAGPSPWTWRPYGGSNPHTKHAHVELLPDARSLTVTPWSLPGLAVDVPQQVTSSRPTIRHGDRGALVALVQRFLGVAPVDAIFGQATRRAVIAYQQMRGLGADGVVGPATWASIDAGLRGPGV